MEDVEPVIIKKMGKAKGTRRIIKPFRETTKKMIGDVSMRPVSLGESIVWMLLFVIFVCVGLVVIAGCIALVSGV